MFAPFQRPIGIFCLAAALLALLSIPVVLPPWADFWQTGFLARAPNDRLSFVLWALGIACFFAGLGYAAGRLKSAVSDNAALILATLAGMVLLDWVLLAHMPRNLYVHDLETIYRYRPNSVQTWPEHLGGKAIRINAHGFHDDWVPLEKPPGQFRALMLGDSVTMGHGVTLRETFSNQLEDEINRERPETCASQIINAGIGGFAIHQELVIFREALAFDPDFVALGFVLNDVSAPFVIDRRMGGLGVDYNGMSQSGSALTGWILNETGMGRLARRISQPDQSMERALRYELFNAKRVTFEALSNAEIRKAWEIVKQDLARVYATAGENDLPLLLMIFPFTFQFLDEEGKLPQQILKQHAAEHGIDTLDFVAVFEDLILQDKGVREAVEQGKSAEEIHSSHAKVIDRYFLDEDHLTPEGHRVVARELHAYLRRKGYVTGKGC